MSVHYKFKSAVEYDTLPVDGVHISLEDLKEAIIQQKRLGRGQPYDLQITNAETKEVYTDDKTLIPKNSSLIVARVPIDPAQMKKPWENKESTALLLSNPSNLMNTEDAAEAAEIDRKIKEVTDLTLMDGSEDDKINAMVAQSTMAYHPSKYVKLRVSRMMGSVPLDYKCYKCHKSGHWVNMCPLNNQDLRKSTGIPSKFLVEVNDPNVPGVMINSSGKYVRLLDMEEPDIERATPPPGRPPPPEEIVCSICKELLRDAVLIPCCAAAFCDECIRNHLVDSEDTKCPSCGKEGISPDTLIPNRYLRIKALQFENGWRIIDKKLEKGATEPLSSIPPYMLHMSNTPTPPRSPAGSSSPTHVKNTDQITTVVPVQPSSPSGPNSVDEPLENGGGDSDKENTVETEENINPPQALNEDVEESEPQVKEVMEDEHQQEGEEQVQLQVTEAIVEAGAELEGKHRKSKKKKNKRKTNRHDSDEERDGKEGRKRKDRRHSHRSQDGKPADTEKEIIHNVPNEVGINVEGLEVEDSWVANSLKAEAVKNRSRSRSRSKSIDKEDTNLSGNIFDNILPFDPSVPPPGAFVQSPPKEPFYSVPSTYASAGPPTHTAPVAVATTQYHPFPPGGPFPTSMGPSHPSTSVVPSSHAGVVQEQQMPSGPHPVGSPDLSRVPPPSYGNPAGGYTGHILPYKEYELIDDPLTLFNKHLREKDERARRYRMSRSRSPRSRLRSRSPRRSWSRSRTRSRSRSRAIGPGVRSPRSPVRHRWSRTPPRGLGSRSQRSPSFTRERSLSNHSLSLSRTPSPSRRIKSSPLQVRPVLPDTRSPLRTHIDYGAPRDYDRYPVNHIMPEEYESYLIGGAQWDPHMRFDHQGHENFNVDYQDSRGRGNRGRRGRDRGGFRQGEDFHFDQRNQELRHPYDRSQPPRDDRRGLIGIVPWEREDSRHSYDIEIGRNERGGRLQEGERRRFGELRETARDFEDNRTRREREGTENARRHDEDSSRRAFEDDEWRRYSDVENRKRFEDEDDRRRHFEGRRGHGDSRSDPEDTHRLPEMDRYDDYKKYTAPRKEGEGRRDEGNRKESDSRRNTESSRKEGDESKLGRHETKRADERERDGKYKSESRHREMSSQDENSELRSRSHDSPSRSYKKSPIRDRRERDLERRDRDSDRRERDGDRKDNYKRERETGDRRDRDRDFDRRPRDLDRRDRDGDRREKEADRKERDSERRERDSQKGEKDHERKERDGDRKERLDERVSKDDNKKDRESRRDRDGDRQVRNCRWDRTDARSEREKESDKSRSERHKGRSQEKEDRNRNYSNDEREDKRKTKQRDEKQDSHSNKEKDSGGKDVESVNRVEKKKHDKKKKKKEKRRASQASTEASQAEISGDEGEDKKKKKKREKKKKVKGHINENKDLESENQPLEETKKLSDTEVEPTPAVIADSVTLPATETSCTTTPHYEESTEADTVIEESTPLPLPQLSKWERDEEVTVTPKGLTEKKVPEEERKVTVDILKRAENAIFSGRGLVSRKVFLDAQKQKEIEERSPTPDWDRTELREAKRRGPSIQITISSKTESQIGRPRGGRSAPSSPERSDERRSTLKSKRLPENELKSERHSSRMGKRSPSPSDTHVIKSRRKSEKEDKSHFNEEKNVIVSQNDTPSRKKSKSPIPECHTNLCEESKEQTKDHKLLETMKEDVSNVSDQKGLKRMLSPGNESEMKRLREDISSAMQDADENVSVVQTDTVTSTLDGEAFPSVEKIEPTVAETGEYEIVEDDSKSISQEILDCITMAPPAVVKDPEELEEGEIPADISNEGVLAREHVAEAPAELEEALTAEAEPVLDDEKKHRYSPIRVPTPIQAVQVTEEVKIKEKSKKRKKRKRSSSSSSSNSSTSSSSSSSEDEEIIKKKKRKKKKKKAADSDSSDGESKSKHKKKKKEKKKKKKKEKKKKSEK